MNYDKDESEHVQKSPRECEFCSVHPADSSKCGHLVVYPEGTFGCVRYGKLLG